VDTSATGASGLTSHCSWPARTRYTGRVSVGGNSCSAEFSPRRRAGSSLDRAKGETLEYTDQQRAAFKDGAAPLATTISVAHSTPSIAADAAWNCADSGRRGGPTSRLSCGALRQRLGQRPGSCGLGRGGGAWRAQIRDHIARHVAMLPPGARVLELGSGPGFLAHRVLERCPNLEGYTLVDFSEPMQALSRERLARFPTASFVCASFKSEDWTRRIGGRFDCVLSMQAVHELRHKRHALRLYEQM